MASIDWFVLIIRYFQFGVTVSVRGGCGRPRRRVFARFWRDFAHAVERPSRRSDFDCNGAVKRVFLPPERWIVGERPIGLGRAAETVYKEN